MSPKSERQPYDRPHGPAYCFVSADTSVRCSLAGLLRRGTLLCITLVASGDRRLCVIL